MDRTIHLLSVETAKLLASTQIITSVSATVKELLENSLDEGALNVQVKLNNFGLDLIEVKDDGPGIDYSNVQKMFLPGYTSKICDFQDLSTLKSYGFRGEALSAICELGDTSITTKTEKDTYAMTYSIDRCGNAVNSQPSQITKGTVISVSKLFNHLPARRQFVSSKKKMADELKNVELIVRSLAIIHPALRISLVHNKNIIWQKSSVGTLKQSFMQAVGVKAASQMEYLKEECGDIALELIVPKKDLKDLDLLFTPSSRNAFLYVNNRPVFIKEISKIITEYVFKVYQAPGNKHILYLVSMNLSPKDIDVNLEPNKTRVLLRNLDLVSSVIRDAISKYYGIYVMPPAPDLPDEEAEHSKFNSSLETSIDGNPCKRTKLSEELSHIDVEPHKGQERRTWNMNVINDDAISTTNETAISFLPDKTDKSHPARICSQINKDNCTLTSEKEVSRMNDVLSTPWGANLAAVLQSAGKPILSHSAPKPVLPDWPCRQQTPEKREIAKKANDMFSPQKTPQKVNEVRLPSTEQSVVEFSSRTNFESNNCQMLEISTIASAARPSITRSVQEGTGDAGTMADWSRGHLKLNDGNVLNGGAAVVVNPQLKEDVGMFDLSLQSVSSQMGKKELSAFTKYARVMRSKITSEYPGLVFTEVSKRLAQGWKDLSLDERNYYEDLQKVVDEERKIHREEKANQPYAAKEKSRNEICKRKRFKRPKRKQVMCEISFKEIWKQRDNRGQAAFNESLEIKLIGQVNGNEWLYYRNGEIGHVRHDGLQELVIYHKMMNSHEISRRKLEKSELLSQESLGSLWQILLELPTEYDEVTGRNIVVSDILTKNGFRVEFLLSNLPTSALLTEVATVIKDHGVPDLMETLHLYDTHGHLASLYNLRPTSVKSYIVAEVIRLVKKNCKAPDEAEMKSLLSTWQLCLNHLPPKCLHENDIFLPIYPILSETKSVQ